MTRKTMTCAAACFAGLLSAAVPETDGSGKLGSDIDASCGQLRAQHSENAIN